MEVDEDCVNDPECTIEVNINVIYDKNAFGGKGLTKAQKKKFEAEQLAKAQEDFGNSNITLNVKYTEGKYDSAENSFSGLDIKSLNVVATGKLSGDHPGIAGYSKDGHLPVVMINVDDAKVKNTLIWANTFEHEAGHHFLGHVDDPGKLKNYPYDASVNSRLHFQSVWGVSQQSMREGLAPRVYAVPANPELNKPGR
jgi:hypothetical protein